MGMRMSSFLDWCLWAVVGGGGKPAKARPLPSGRGGLCVLGCTPHVDPYRLDAGILKYEALVEEMAETCDVIVHVGDTKPGRMPCNETLMTPAVHKLIDAGKRQNTLVLYAPGDNELNDCHRHASAPVERRVPSEIITAKDDRNFLVRDLNVISGQDLTGTYSIDQHEKSEDERFDAAPKDYPFQDDVDPLSSRFPLYVNAKDCALEWIEKAPRRASEAGKSALFFMFHATFYQKNGVMPTPVERLEIITTQTT